MHDIYVHGRDAAILAKADFNLPLKTGARAPETILLFPRHPQQDRALGFFREQSRNAPLGILDGFTAKPAAAVLGYQDDLRRGQSHHLGDARHDKRPALTRSVQDEFAILPVGEGRARLHRVVGHRLGDKRLFQHQIRLLKSRLKIAVLPFLGWFSHRQPVFTGRGKIFRFPFDGLQRQAHVCHIALGARIGPSGPQALQRIDHEGQGLQIDLNRFNG